MKQYLKQKQIDAFKIDSEVKLVQTQIEEFQNST